MLNGYFIIKSETGELIYHKCFVPIEKTGFIPPHQKKVIYTSTKIAHQSACLNSASFLWASLGARSRASETIIHLYNNIIIIYPSQALPYEARSKGFGFPVMIVASFRNMDVRSVNNSPVLYPFRHQHLISHEPSIFSTTTQNQNISNPQASGKHSFSSIFGAGQPSPILPPPMERSEAAVGMKDITGETKDVGFISKETKSRRRLSFSGLALPPKPPSRPPGADHKGKGRAQIERDWERRHEKDLDISASKASGSPSPFIILLPACSRDIQLRVTIDILLRHMILQHIKACGQAKLCKGLRMHGMTMRGVIRRLLSGFMPDVTDIKVVVPKRDEKGRIVKRKRQSWIQGEGGRGGEEYVTESLTIGKSNPWAFALYSPAYCAYVKELVRSRDMRKKKWWHVQRKDKIDRRRHREEEELREHIKDRRERGEDVDISSLENVGKNAKGAGKGKKPARQGIFKCCGRSAANASSPSSLARSRRESVDDISPDSKRRQFIKVFEESSGAEYSDQDESLEDSDRKSHKSIHSSKRVSSDSFQDEEYSLSDNAQAKKEEFISARRQEESLENVHPLFSVRIPAPEPPRRLPPSPPSYDVCVAEMSGYFEKLWSSGTLTITKGRKSEEEEKREQEQRDLRHKEESDRIAIIRKEREKAEKGQEEIGEEEEEEEEVMYEKEEEDSDIQVHTSHNKHEIASIPYLKSSKTYQSSPIAPPSPHNTSSSSSSSSHRAVAGNLPFFSDKGVHTWSQGKVNVTKVDEGFVSFTPVSPPASTAVCIRSQSHGEAVPDLEIEKKHKNRGLLTSQQHIHDEMGEKDRHSIPKTKRSQEKREKPLKKSRVVEFHADDATTRQNHERGRASTTGPSMPQNIRERTRIHSPISLTYDSIHIYQRKRTPSSKELERSRDSSSRPTSLSVSDVVDISRVHSLVHMYLSHKTTTHTRLKVLMQYILLHALSFALLGERRVFTGENNDGTMFLSQSHTPSIMFEILLDKKDVEQEGRWKGVKSAEDEPETCVLRINLLLDGPLIVVWCDGLPIDGSTTHTLQGMGSAKASAVGLLHDCMEWSYLNGW
ncbi:hypothetical protein ADUPG1_008086 [Aduncisulcus paluster]|uniref:Uncharacterized protein n=1 Tax=Aduncisulcus paluster TaxID=2918883 RepID=A0ABQ5KTT4_9EUKA|nr:hypothetical protein ADUPG1_008086 [Aduncisulcus paluster]